MCAIADEQWAALVGKTPSRGNDRAKDQSALAGISLCRHVWKVHHGTREGFSREVRWGCTRQECNPTGVEELGPC